LPQITGHLHRAGTARTERNRPYTTEHQVLHAEELVSWIFRERLQFLWYRLRLTVRSIVPAVRCALLSGPVGLAPSTG